MDIQLFATDEELQDFPENKTELSTVQDFPENKTDSSIAQDKAPNTKSINLMVSDLPRSHSHLPRIPSRLPERKSKRKIRREHRRKSRSNTEDSIGSWQATLAKNPTVYRQAEYPIVHWQAAQARKPIAHRQSVQANDQLKTKQEIQWIGKLIHQTYLDQLVGRQGGPSLSKAALPGQPVLGSPEIDPPVAHQLLLCPPVVRPPMARQLAFPQPVDRQPSHHVPSLLSLRLQPDLNSLARTLSPQALRCVQLSIQISQNLLN